MLETQRRAGFPQPALQRYRIAWRGLAGAGRATILEARRGDELLASGMLVVEGDRSFYLFSGSRREEPGEPKHYASYVLQWEMMRRARDRRSSSTTCGGSRQRAPVPSTPGTGWASSRRASAGGEVVWAGTWDIVVDRTLYRLRNWPRTGAAARGACWRACAGGPMSQPRGMGLGQLADVIGPERVVGVPVGEVDGAGL